MAAGLFRAAQKTIFAQRAKSHFRRGIWHDFRHLRLSPKIRFPAATDDVAIGPHYIKAHAKNSRSIPTILYLFLMGRIGRGLARFVLSEPMLAPDNRVAGLVSVVWGA